MRLADITRHEAVRLARLSLERRDRKAALASSVAQARERRAAAMARGDIP